MSSSDKDDGLFSSLARTSSEEDDKKKKIKKKQEDERKVRLEKAVLDVSSLLEEDQDYINGILLEAERLIDIVTNGMLTFGRLRKRDRCLLAMYFYITNPVFNRIINLHVKLPLSSMTLQKPKVDNSLVQDYVFNYFEKFLKKLNWRRLFFKVVLNYFLFGDSLVLVEDEFFFTKDTDVDEDMVMEKLSLMKPEVRKKVEKIVAKYDQKGENSVTKEELNYVIGNYMLNYNPNYKGVLAMRLLDPFKMESVDYNDEIGLNVYEYPKSIFIKKYLEDNRSYSFDDSGKEHDKKLHQDLVDLGYTKSYLKMNLSAKTDENLQFTNDPFDDAGCYVAEMTSAEISGVDINMVSPILSDLIRYYLCMKALDDRISLSRKKTILLSADADVSEPQLTTLESRIQTSTEETGGSYIATNYPVNVQEVRFDAKDDLQLEDIREVDRQHILMGTGTPEALVTGDETYGSSFLKLEVLNQEFLTFREAVQDFFEEKILKPVALKRGFVTTDIFGNLVPIYPKINFEVGSIIGQNDFKDVLRDLTSQQMFPVSKLLEYYGFDFEELYQRMKKDQEMMAAIGMVPGMEGGMGGGEEYYEEQQMPPEQQQQMVPEEQQQYEEQQQQQMVPEEQQQYEEQQQQQPQQPNQQQQQVSFIVKPKKLREGSRKSGKVRGVRLKY